MEGRIDPPSSLNALTLETICDHCKSEEAWVCASPPLACMFLTRKEDYIYLGKLAVSQPHRKKGLARCLIKHAETRAAVQGYKELKLQTRVELTENHCFFERLGFVKTAETRHVGYTRNTPITMVKQSRAMVNHYQSPYRRWRDCRPLPWADITTDWHALSYL